MKEAPPHPRTYSQCNSPSFYFSVLVHEGRLCDIIEAAFFHAGVVCRVLFETHFLTGSCLISLEISFSRLSFAAR